MIINNFYGIKTRKQLDDKIDELENELAFQERCLYSNDALEFAFFEPKIFQDLNDELTFFQRISNKLFDKWLKTI